MEQIKIQLKASFIVQLFIKKFNLKEAMHIKIIDASTLLLLF